MNFWNGMKKEEESIELPTLSELEAELEREERKMRYRGELGKIGRYPDCRGMRAGSCG